MRERVSPGRGGLARAGVDPSEAYWLENWQILRDGIYRPRFGLKWVKTMSGAVTDLSKAAGYNHNLMVISNSGSLDQLNIETEVLTNAGTGWPTTPISKCLAPGLTGNRWVGCKSPIGGAVGTLYTWDGTTLAALTCDQGNWVACHADFAVRVASGSTDPALAIQWSALGDVTNWPAQNARGPIPQMGTTDCVLPYSASESILLGPYGFGTLRGRNPDRPAWEMGENALLLTPMHLAVQCRDRIIIPAAGPSLLEYVPPGVPRRIELPLGLDLLLAQGGANLRAWYNPTLNLYCLTDKTQHHTYLYSIDLARWLGVWTHAGGSSFDLLGQADVDQGASTVDAATMPWGKSFLAAGSLILQIDPSIVTDAVSNIGNTAFTCKVETQPSSGGDPSAHKQLNGIEVEGVGSYTPYYRYRDPGAGTWTTVTEPTPGAWTFTAPGRFDFPLSSVTYRERVVGISATAASTLRFKSILVDESTVAVD